MRYVLAVVVVLAACKGGSTPPADPVKPAEPAQPAQPAQPAKPKPAIVGIELPEVTQAGFEDLATAPMVMASSATLSVVDDRGKTAIVPIVDGDVDPSEKEGGALGLKIPKLTAYLATLARVSNGDTLLVALDRATPAKLLVAILFSAKQNEAGYKKFQILAQAGDKLVGAPLRLPERAPAAAVAPGERKPGDCDTPLVMVGSGGDLPPAPPNTAVKPVVTITKDKIILWSITQLEGSLKAPKAEFPVDDKAPAAISGALAEIVKRRWSGGTRPECSGEIIVMPDSSIPMSVVVPILGAVRSTADGTELFPDVLLSPGLE